MTRFLAESLQADTPSAGVRLKNLEAAHGHPNTDIRFSTQVKQETRTKLRALGLDPDDTTPEELYHALQERMKADDRRLVKRLRTTAATHVSAEAEVVAGMAHALRRLPGQGQCFALKNSRLRSMLRQSPPKKAMKKLGYRSMDSFLKHESPVSVLAAAWLCESLAWKQRFLGSYTHLQPGDFESRELQIIYPDSKHWRDLAAEAVGQARHNILSFEELGTLILLPLPEDMPPGAVTVSLGMALSGLNQIRAGSTFLKLCQVRPDFGDLVKAVAGDEPRLVIKPLDQPMSWQLIQRYYARVAEQFREGLFEPHIRLEDMAWQPIEQSLAAIDPDFEFWKDSSYLGMLHEHGPVSLNVIDVALNYCNKLRFNQRISRYFRQSLWHELLLRYLDRDSVEQSVASVLQPEPVLALDEEPDEARVAV